MIKRQRKLDKEEIARRGHAIYQRRVKRKLTGERLGRVVALDVDTSDFEVADNALQAAEKLRLRRPRAQVWLERIGYRALHRIGFWSGEGTSK